MLVALLQNSQWPGDEATNEKLDAVAGGLAETMESVHLLMHTLDLACNDHEIDRAAAQLRHTVGIEKRTSSSSGHRN